MIGSLLPAAEKQSRSTHFKYNALCLLTSWLRENGEPDTAQRYEKMRGKGARLVQRTIFGLLMALTSTTSWTAITNRERPILRAGLTSSSPYHWTIPFSIRNTGRLSSRSPKRNSLRRSGYARSLRTIRNTNRFTAATSVRATALTIKERFGRG